MIPFALLFGLMASCSPDESRGEEPRAFRSYLVVDADAGEPLDDGQAPGVVFAVDAERGTATVFASDERFLDPQRIVPDHKGGFWLLDFGGDPSRADRRRGGLFRLDAGGRVTDAWHPRELAGPTSILAVGESTLFVADRLAPHDEGSRSRGAVFSLRPDGRTCRLLAAHPEFFAPSDLRMTNDGALWLLDADARGAKAGFEGALFRLDPETGDILETVRLEHTISPLGLLPLAGGRWLVVDANCDPRGAGGPLGAVFEVDPRRGTTAVVASPPRLFRDPVRAIEIRPGTVVLVDANADPLGRGPDRIGRGQNQSGGGALLRLDLETGSVECLAAPPEFVNPVDVIPWR